MEKLPIKYIRLSLSIKKSRIIDIQLMIQMIWRRMEVWKSNFYPMVVG